MKSCRSTVKVAPKIEEHIARLSSEPESISVLEAATKDLPALKKGTRHGMTAKLEEVMLESSQKLAAQMLQTRGRLLPQLTRSWLVSTPSLRSLGFCRQPARWAS